MNNKNKRTLKQENRKETNNERKKPNQKDYMNNNNNDNNNNLTFLSFFLYNVPFCPLLFTSCLLVVTRRFL